jgi:uncharacterized heparinase superfamily protein
MLILAEKPKNIFGVIKTKANQVTCQSSFYHWLLSNGSPPNQLKIKLTDPWPGSADKGHMMNHGIFMHQGITLKIGHSFWSQIDNLSSASSVIHRFSWLRDLRAAGGDLSRQLARGLVQQWIEKYNRWDEQVWSPDIMGQRITMWISFYDFFCGSADTEFQKNYFSSLYRQARHLFRTPLSELKSIQALEAAEGLIYAGLSLSEEENWAARGFEILLNELPKQINKDGSHISGNPENVLKCSRILLNLRYALHKAHLPIPKVIEDSILRTGNALKFFSYPDRKLALFHGGQESEANAIDAILSQIRSVKYLQKDSSIGGFERAMLGRAMLMIDTGIIPSHPHNKTCHSAPLAFEFCYGRDRIFTNCGGHPFDSTWQQGLRHTAAHNGLYLNDKPVHDFLESGEILKSHSPICSVRRENKEAILIDVSHDAYRLAHGIDHKRRFYLSSQGQDFRGEDSLISRIPITKPVSVTIRFHLHPRVQVLGNADGDDILITLAGGTSWKFSFLGAKAKIESSIYLGSGAKPVKTKQIVLTTHMQGDECQVKWALQKI